MDTIMTIICQCRQISDTRLKEIFDDFRAANPDSDIDPHQDLKGTIGDYVCGGCSRLFARAAQQFNETGDFNLFPRSNAMPQEDMQEGLCSTAASRKYAGQGIPDLRKPAIEGEPA